MPKKYLTDEESAHLLEFCERENTKHALLMELLVRTGMRTDEMVRLRREDFIIRESQVRVHAAKGSFDRSPSVDPAFMARFVMAILPLMSDSRPSLGHLISKMRSKKTEHRQVRWIWAKIRRQCFGDTVKLSVHCLRHTYGVTAHKAHGNDLPKTQVAMGHKSMNSTSIYARWADEEELQDGILNAFKRIKERRVS